MCNYVIVSLKACGLMGFCRRFSGCAEEKRRSVDHACIRYKCHQCARESCGGCGLGQQVLSKPWGMEFPLHGGHVDQDWVSVSLSSFSAVVCIVFGGFGETNVVGMACLW